MLFTISFYFTIYDNYTSKTCDSLCIMFEIVKRMCPQSSTLICKLRRKEDRLGTLQINGKLTKLLYLLNSFSR